MNCCCNGSKTTNLIVAASSSAVILFAAWAADDDKSSPSAMPASPLAHTMTLIDGSPQNLAEYRGKVVLIVNVASKCGLTPQYEGLESLYRAHKDQGFVILAFPANNFMGQEPGSDEEIAAFCAENYGVTFPMFSKISVKGDDIHPLYQDLTSLPEPLGGEIRWNFEKFLIDRQGHVIERFHPRIKPDAPELTELITKALAQPAPNPA